MTTAVKKLWQSSKKQLNIWTQNFCKKKRLLSEIFPLRVPLRVLKADPEQWYISSVESPKFPLRFEKFYELWFFIKKNLRLYLQTCGVLKWKQYRQKVRRGRKKFYLISAKYYELLNIFEKKIAQSLPLDR